MRLEQHQLGQLVHVDGRHPGAAAPDQKPAERDDEGWNLQAGHENAVEQSDHRCDRKSERDRQIDRDPMNDPHDGELIGGEPVHRVGLVIGAYHQGRKGHIHALRAIALQDVGVQ